jgi:beta-glucanase (GH16 family)
LTPGRDLDGQRRGVARLATDGSQRGEARADFTAGGAGTQAKLAGGAPSCVRVRGRTRIARPAVLGGIALVLLAILVSPAHTAPRPVGHGGRWHLIFDDEFAGTRLDTAKWSTGWYGSGITGPVNPGEMQCYDPAQVAVGGGELDIRLVARSERCSTGSGTRSRPYVSGIVTTNGSFSYTYGYLEARVWMPGSRAIEDWPAVWAVGDNWPAGGELDLVEGLDGRACWHFHDPAGAPGGCSSKRFAGGWHTFGADWEKGVVSWYYDGARVGAVRAGVTSDPMYLVLDLGVRDPAYGGPIDVPASLRVDYVRVWAH